MSVFELEKGIYNNVSDKIKSSMAALTAVDKTFRLIDAELSDETKWAGSARDRCAEAHEAAKMYVEMIEPICVDLYKLLVALDSDVESFNRAM